MRGPALLFLTCLGGALSAQNVSNISCSSTLAEQVMMGQYDPSAFTASTVIDDHEAIICALRTEVSPDSLKAHLAKLTSFHNRNTYSDTLSSTSGIGAARRWAYSRFQAYAAQNEDRLIPAYLRFDYQTSQDCGDVNDLRNVIAVLPGSDASNPSIVLIEAHMDSRCTDNCDTLCLAQGAEDNGSGTALVMELARVMSRYTFDHTLVFMLTTGEEQGLVGAEAMATYCETQGIAIKGVQNNDIVGGVLCGASSSDPGCEVEGDVDSLNVRLFSYGASNAPYRGFARTIKMYYQEKLQDEVPVPMTVHIMGQEDREGRGGDHIPFRLRGYRNVRFTAANEHGDANVDSSWYHDHQHTSDDILGVDTDGDLVIDSFFVDFNYLQRNAVINGTSMTLLALGPEPPVAVVHDEPTGLRVSFQPQAGIMAYRVGIRASSSSLDFDMVYRTSDTSFVIPGLDASHFYYVSTAAIDSATIMSPFTAEVAKSNDMETPPAQMDQLPYHLNCIPISVPEVAAKPSLPIISCQLSASGDRTIIVVDWPPNARNKQAAVLVHDVNGHVVGRIPFLPQPGKNELVFPHTTAAGLYTCGLVANGVIIAADKFIVP
jgi:hypothetical protein